MLAAGLIARARVMAADDRGLLALSDVFFSHPITISFAPASTSHTGLVGPSGAIYH